MMQSSKNNDRDSALAGMSMSKRMLRNQIKLLALLLAFGCFCLQPSRVRAQGITTGSITGTVVDPQGAVVPGATITATETATGVVHTTISQGNGGFAFRDLPIGTYTVHIQATGFQALDVKSVPVVSGGVANLKNEKLSIGASTTVQVHESSNVQLNTTESQVSTTFSTSQLRSLPLGNGFDSVMALTPGVARTHDVSYSESNATGGFSVNGQRGKSNNFELDGQANNDRTVAGPELLFGNQDAIQEIQVITNNFSAQYGENMGAVVNYITKSGTNAFHGTGFEMYTGSWLGSLGNQEKTPLYGFCMGGQTPAANGCIVPKLPRLTDNQFGGTLGGPILKNKLWFFGSGYGQRVFTGVIPASSGGLVTPTPAGLAQLAADFPGSSAVGILSKYGPFGVTVGNPIVIPGTTENETITLPNGATTQVQVGQFQRAVSVPLTDKEYLGRVDWQPTQNDHAFVRYYYQKFVIQNNVGAIAPGSWTSQIQAEHSVGADWTHTFSPSFTNQLRYSFQQSKPDFEGGSDPNCTVVDITACPSNVVFIGGTTDAGFGLNPGLPQGRTVKDTQIQDNATWTKGNHTILLGGEFDLQNTPNAYLPSYNGTFLYANLSDFLNDSNGLVDLANGNVTKPFTENDFALYAQDDWKVTDNVTLNLGLRYEYFGQTVNQLHKLSLAQQTGPNPFWNTALPLSDTTAIKVNNQWKNFEPRLGFNWNPSAFNSKLVIRGGYAINYDVIWYNPFLVGSGFAPTTITSVFGCNGPCLPPGGQFSGAAVRAADLHFLPIGGDPRLANEYTFPKNLRYPYAQTYYLGLQYQLSNSVLVSASYVGVHGSQNLQAIDENPYLLPVAQNFPNVVAPGSLCQDPSSPGFGRPDCTHSNVNLISNGAFLIYNGLQTNLTTRNVHGLTATLSYTYSRAIDNVSSIFSSGAGGVSNAYAQNPLNTDLGERGVGGTSFPNVFSLAATYQFPWYQHRSGLKGKLLGGFSLNAIWGYNSGQPYNPVQPLVLPSGDTSYCDGVFNASFVGTDTCRLIVSNPHAPLNTVAYLTTDPATPNAPPAYYVYGSTGQVSSTGMPIPGTLISPSNARWIVDNQLEANRLGNPYPGSGRNILRGQPYNNVDASVFKTVPLRGRLSLQLQLTAYNAFNHDFLGTPIISLGAYSANAPVNPFLSNKYNGSGAVNLQNAVGNRLIQIGGKIIF